MSRWITPKKCPRCNKRLHKADGEGYNTKLSKAIKFRLGRVCIRCEIVFLNPHFKDCEIILDSEVGA